MVKSIVVIAAIGILPAGVYAGCRPHLRESDSQAINRLQVRVDSAIIAGDIERYLALLTSDAVLMPPNEPPVTGRNAIRSWSEAMSRRARIQEYRPTDEEVVVAGDWAFRRGSFHWTVVPTGSVAPLRDHGKFIIIYRRGDDGAWRVAWDIWNSNTSPRRGNLE